MELLYTRAYAGQWDKIIESAQDALVVKLPSSYSRNTCPESLIHRAAYDGRDDVIRGMVQHLHADVNLRSDATLSTPLMCSTQQVHLDTMRLLVSLGMYFLTLSDRRSRSKCSK